MVDVLDKEQFELEWRVRAATASAPSTLARHRPENAATFFGPDRAEATNIAVRFLVGSFVEALLGFDEVTSMGQTPRGTIVVQGRRRRQVPR